MCLEYYGIYIVLCVWHIMAYILCCVFGILCAWGMLILQLLSLPRCCEISIDCFSNLKLEMLCVVNIF